MKQYILFDLDGTLTDPMEGITKSVQYALKKYDIQEEIENLICFIGPPLEESFMDFYGFDEKKAREAILYYRERYRKTGIFENKLISGIPEALHALKSFGKTLAVATSKPTEFAVQICDRFDLSRYFDCIIGSELDGSRTKKNEVIEEAMRQLSCTAEATIMVGDRKHDIIGAKKCGLQSIGVTFGYALPGELQEAGADYIIHTPDELLPLFH